MHVVSLLSWSNKNIHVSVRKQYFSKRFSIVNSSDYGLQGSPKNWKLTKNAIKVPFRMSLLKYDFCNKHFIHPSLQYLPNIDLGYALVDTWAWCNIIQY